MAYDKNKHDVEWSRNHLDKITIVLPKGKGDILRDLATIKNVSMSRLIIRAVEAQYHIQLLPEDEIDNILL